MPARKNKKAQVGQDLKTLPPFIGVLLFLFALIPFMNFWSYSPAPGWISQSMALILASLICLQGLWQRRKQNQWSLPLFAAYFLVLMLLGLGSQFYNSLYYTGSAWLSALTLGMAALLGLVIYQLTREGYEILQPLCRGLFFGLFVQVLFFNLQLWGVISLYNQWVHDLPLWIPHFPPLRGEPTGLLFQRNLFVDYTIIAFLAGPLLYSQKKIRSWSLFLILPLASLALAITTSRMVLLFMGLLFVTSLIYRESDSQIKQLRLWTISFSVVTGLFILLFPYFQDWIPGFHYSTLSRLEGTHASYGMMGYRSLLWEHGWQMFLEHPWLGAGPGSFLGHHGVLQGAMDFHPIFINEADAMTHSHNMFIQLLAEYGCVAFLLTLIFLILLCWHLVKQRPSPQHFFSLIALGILLIHSQLEYPLWHPSFLFLSVILVASQWPQGQVPKPSLPFVALLGGLTSSALILLGAISQWPLYGRLASIASLRQSPEKSIPADRRTLDQASRNPFFNLKADILRLHLFMDTSSKNLDAKLALTSRITRQRPTSYTLYRHAIHLAHAKRPQEALQALQTAYHLNPAAIFQMARWFNATVPDPRLLILRAKLLEYMKHYQNLVPPKDS